MAERNKTKTEPVVKCCRTICVHTTRSPKASGWVYVDEVGDEAPLELQHWAGGWLCRQCFKNFQKLMAANGIEPETGRTH
jgi:hypothetical protein